MYEKFYGLKRAPFELSPNPYFFYPTPAHNEALAILSYGIVRRKGFVVVTGEVGTGKTMLLRCVLESLTRNDVAFAFVHNPKLSVCDFLQYVLADFRLPAVGSKKGEMLAYLNSFLLLRSRRNNTTALIVDEAHLLSAEMLEEIRLLTNLETSQHKLLQIVLVGQPELDRMLDSSDLRQLKQRVGLRCQLRPLGFEELRGYIRCRLELAGANLAAAPIFSDEVMGGIHELSQGIPRVVNNLCENSLISGYGKQIRQITPEIIREVAKELRIDRALPEEFSSEAIDAYSQTSEISDSPANLAREIDSKLASLEAGQETR